MPHHSEPINILFVLPSFDTGGSEKLVVDIIRHLDPSRFRPVLAVFFGGRYEASFRELGYPLYVIHGDGVKSRLGIMLSLSRIVRKHRIHAVNTHHPSALINGFAPFRLLNRVKWVHTEHTQLDREAGIGRPVLLATRILLKTVDLCVGISDNVCRYLGVEMGVPASRIRKIINGVNVSRFNLPGFDRAAYREGLGLTVDTLAVGLVANFRPQKNHANLIRAVKLLKDKGGARFKVFLCGEGEEFGDARALVERLGVESHVEMLGVRFDIPEFMNAIDIYCLPSRFEGLPLSLLEAMACGRAVVATDVPGNDEVVIHAHNGLLCLDDDPEDLAEKLGQLLSSRSLRESLGVAAYDTAREMSYDNMMMAYEALFSEI